MELFGAFTICVTKILLFVDILGLKYIMKLDVYVLLHNVSGSHGIGHFIANLL